MEHEWWTYEVCFGRRARQFHQATGPSGELETHSLGAYVASAAATAASASASARSASWRMQRYRGGEACATGQVARNVEVRLECSPTAAELQLTNVIEPSTCHYLMTVLVPQAQCGQLDGGGGASGDAHATAASQDAAGALPDVSKLLANAAAATGAAVGAALPAAAEPTAAASSSSAGGVGGASSGVLVAGFDPTAAERTLDVLQALDKGGAADVEPKRLAVVHAIRHAWRGYADRAFGADEVRPISGGRNDWIGLGLTILDSLDVLWMAGLREEYTRAAAWVHASLNLDKHPRVSFFETTIRCLGGLLAAYELSGDAVFLTKATDLGQRLGRAFESPSGMPYTAISLSTGEHTVPSWLGGNVLLAEVGTVQMEFGSLAHHAGRPELRAKSDKVFDLLDKRGPQVRNGGRLWPIHVRPSDGSTTGGVISWGAMGDSYYEYLLKYWLLTGKKHEQYKRMYLEATKAMLDQLLLVDPSSGLTYVAESKNGRIERKMDHLVCFVPGMLALGAQHLPEVRERHMDAAARLAETCYQMYARQATGLAPEFVRFNGGGMTVGAAHNLLRPEAIEALFYMWRFTKDPKYREWGWRMFLAFEKHCKVKTGGYVGLRNVNIASPGAARDDKMETFWLAESLKYFLLLFSDDSLLDLNTHVLNTEAHPLRVLPD
jgi:hypothetical protein